MNFFALKNSRQSEIVSVDTESNSGVIGRYIFRTDLDVIVASTELQSCTNTGFKLYSLFLHYKGKKQVTIHDCIFHTVNEK